MRTMIPAIMLLCLALPGCKNGPKDHLRNKQWLTESHVVNGVDIIDSSAYWTNVRYTFYEDGMLHRSNNATETWGYYFLDEDNMRLMMLQEDTVQYDVLELNATVLHLYGRKGQDTIVVKMRS